jgi:hypothetical protein
MLLAPVFAALEAAPFATAIREGSFFFPLIESVHVLAVVLVVGVVFIMDLRLLGFASHSRSVERVLADAAPCAWIAFVVALVSGFLLFASSATTYAVNPAFQLKFAVMAVAGVNMLAFHGVTQRTVQTWDDARPPPQARLAGLISITCWLVIVGAGRWIGFMA